MKKNVWVWAVMALIGLGYNQWHKRHDAGNRALPTESSIQQQSSGGAAAAGGEDAIRQAFAQHQSNVQVQGSGTVIKTLPDDRNGTAHQRFILKLSDGLSVLVAHNIDLAPRLQGLAKGDTVGFSGEYEWSEQGGVVHWTHHDPSGRHADGWLSYRGQQYR